MKNKRKEIRNLIGQIWCLPAVYFERFVQDLELQGKQIAEESFLEKLAAMWSWRDEETKPEPEGYELVEFEGKTLAVVQIEGILVKKADYWDRNYGGMYGTSDLLPIIDEIEADPSIGGLMLIFNSPGGSVAGIEVLANRLYAFKKTSVALVDEMCCSGAYWLAAQTNKIISAGKTAEVGSIGVVAKHRDYSERNKIEGLKITYLTADGSPDKAFGNPDEPLNAKSTQALTDLLNPVYETFVAQVRKSRRSIDPQALTGKIFLAEQALELGLIDQIGLESDALKFLSQKVESNSKKFIEKMNAEIQPVAQANAQAAQVVPPAPDQNALLAQMLTQMTAQMTALTEKITGVENKVSALSTENGELKTKLAQAEQKAQTAEQQAQSAQAQNAQLEQKLNDTPEPQAQIPTVDPKAFAGTPFGLAVEKEGFAKVQARYAEYASQPWNKRP